MALFVHARACNSVWHSSVMEYYCVDMSQDMNTLARLLLQGTQFAEYDFIAHGLYIVMCSLNIVFCFYNY